MLSNHVIGDAFYWVLNITIKTLVGILYADHIFSVSMWVT